MKNLDYGKNYEYPHDHPEHFIDANYFPKNVTNFFYSPTKLGYEKYISERLSKLWPSRFNK
jgi:putative ATPase